MAFQDCQSISDEEALNRIRNGETGLYELIMRRYNQRLFRIIRSVVKEEREAEDILQESWVLAYEHLDQFAGRSTLSTWLCKVAFHEALSRAKKAKRWLPLEGEMDHLKAGADSPNELSSTPEALAIRNQVGQVLRSAVDALPDLYRSVFMLRDVEGMSTTETAECLDLSEETVKTRLHRSRSMLRRDLQSRMGPAVSETFAFMGERCDRTVAAVMQRIAAQPAAIRS
jgi:RNA polymerase sigma-70 factor (ECF subfamily)